MSQPCIEIDRMSKGMSSVPFYPHRSHGQPFVERRFKLFGRFISLLVRLLLQPSAISEERDDPDGDKEHDAKHHDDTGVLGSPVLLSLHELVKVCSFEEQVDSLCLGPVEQVDRGHDVLIFGREKGAVDRYDSAELIS